LFNLPTAALFVSTLVKISGVKNVANEEGLAVLCQTLRTLKRLYTVSPLPELLRKSLFDDLTLSATLASLCKTLYASSPANFFIKFLSFFPSLKIVLNLSNEKPVELSNTLLSSI
jgi:hypothetical protein